MNECLVAKLKCGEESGPGPGYHDYVYKDVPAIGEKIHAEQELDNAVDKFAEKVAKDNETVGHLPHEYS